MSRNPRLNDLQLILLTTAAKREDGSIFPPAESIAEQGERIGKAVTPLLRRGLIEEVPVEDRKRAWREDSQQAIGLAITSAGRAIIGAEEEGKGASAQNPASPQFDDKKLSPATGRETKAELVLGLLRRGEGATIADLIEGTGWLPHTTRAALTGLRKKGHSIEKSKRGNITCYRITEAA